ncbi:hypothetical protein AXF42_Ash008411 [Apostasia shenzhenica]|uniref:Uncharacterized protein n=1 Tax=Apostasia shenzhenica TaxID=1088818 RepID=A0A2I0AXS6_9ASPA|nr:hypothetical protein AXF42_Ash008411 [Apostasia shenzhenica]
MELTAISEISAELTEISAILKLMCFLFLQKFSDGCPPLTLSRRKTALAIAEELSPWSVSVLCVAYFPGSVALASSLRTCLELLYSLLLRPRPPLR